MSELPGRGVDLGAAQLWIRYQFEGMSALLERVVADLGELDEAHVLVSAAFSGDVTLDNTGRGLDQDTEELTRVAFSRMYTLGARTLIVEDDLASRSDDPDDAFFVHDAVLRSVALDEDAGAAVHLLRTRSSGYPSNAIICTKTEADLGLSKGISLSEDVVTLVAQSSVGALTSVWDDETYLVMWRSSSTV